MLKSEIQIEMEDFIEEENVNDDSQANNTNVGNSVDSSDEEEDEDELDMFDIYSEDDMMLQPISMDIKKLICKLDLVLDMLIQHIGVQIKTDKTLFELLLILFDTLCLPTHRLRCTQFLIFYASSLDPSYPEEFLGLLLGKAVETSHPVGVRVAAASYLASYVSRAKFVNVDSIRTVLRLLNQFCLGYLDEYESTVTLQNIGKHGLFYAIVQAIFYIFCFKWKSLMESGSTLPVELNGFQRILTSRLCPLMVCSEHIVDEFARITHSLDILYCYPFMSKETNEKWRMDSQTRDSIPSSQKVTPQKALSSSTRLILQRLDTFFPFDPLSLPQCKKYVIDIYEEWQGNGDDSDTEEDLLEKYMSGTSLD